ncbi:hypothetical protein Tco_0470830 [Tanacetum coccineum]
MVRCPLPLEFCNLSSPSKNAYSRWGGSSLSSTSGGSSTEDSMVLSSQSLRFFPKLQADIVLIWEGGVVSPFKKLLLEEDVP